MSIVLLTLALSLTQAQEIKLEGLDNGPGLLPFKLGQMRLTTHYHTFLHYIDLTDINNNINLIRTQISEIKNKLDNQTYSLYQFQIDHLIIKINKTSSHLRMLEPNRYKRSLIDGLGSIIKSITGNLDYTDAIKYDNALITLKNNQNKIIAQQNNHISLSKEIMDEHTHIISKLVENQIQLNKTMHVLLDTNKFAQYSLLKFAKFAQVLTIITDNIDSVFSEISRLENALAYCSESRTHHSMLSIDIMNKTLSKLRTFYSKVEILDIDFREYYDVIKPASYYSNNQIVFAFKFPILSPLTFSLYRLIIVPNKNNLAIIPPFPLLAITGRTHVYIEAECPKVSSYYLCEETLNHQIRTHPDCISSIIEGQPPDHSCKKTIINLTKPAMEKLDERQYVIIFPNSTQVHLTCERDESIYLSGSFLATIPQNCKLHTDEFTIININDRTKGQAMKITGITWKTFEDLSSPLPPALKIDTISLRNLHDVQTKISIQEPISTEPTSIVYHTTIPFYGITGASIIIILIIILKKYIKNKKETARSGEPDTPLTKIGDETDQTQSKMSSIFHSKGLK